MFEHSENNKSVGSTLMTAIFHFNSCVTFMLYRLDALPAAFENVCLKGA